MTSGSEESLQSDPNKQEMVGEPERIPERDELLAAVERVRPVLEKSSAAANQERTLPAPVVAALHEANLFRFVAPREVGGFAADPLTTTIGNYRATGSVDTAPATVGRRGSFSFFIAGSRGISCIIIRYITIFNFRLNGN